MKKIKIIASLILIASGLYGIGIVHAKIETFKVHQLCMDNLIRETFMKVNNFERAFPDIFKQAQQERVDSCIDMYKKGAE